MLASIHPLGERSRSSRWIVTVTAYLVGSVAGGALMGCAAGSLGWLFQRALALPAAVSMVAAAVACALAAAIDLRGSALPSVHRQVNDEWLHRYRGWVYGLGFGFQLGLGFVTIVTTATVYATAALALLRGSAAAGLVIGVTFGAARGAVILTTARVRTPAELRRAQRDLDARAGFAARMTDAVAIAAAVVLGVGWLAGLG